MVFSQTSHKAQSILKVVELDRLKPAKTQQPNSSTGVATEVRTSARPASPLATSSFYEEYLKPEPVFETKMYHESDCEFFQDLLQWCSDPAKEEQAQTIDPQKATKERAHNTDTLHTPFSPQGWDGFDANSPTAQSGFYNTTPNDPLSPMDGFAQDTILYKTDLDNEKKVQFQEQFLDISSLPVVFEDLVSEVVDPNPWPTTTQVNTEYTKLNTNLHTMPFIDPEDSLDLKPVKPQDVENDVIITEYIVNNDLDQKVVLEELTTEKRGGLHVDVVARPPTWPAIAISTPDIVNYVDQLEKEKNPFTNQTSALWSPKETKLVTTDTCPLTTPPPVDYEPITPGESHLESDEDTRSRSGRRRRHNSEDSDETYTPYEQRTTPRKYKRRKTNLEDRIRELEGSQMQNKARRGRPPKRRESTVSSVYSVDENSSSVSTQETKYRELRDKNNEASKRSRMNRKLKELQMEQLAVELEERNKKLKVRADILEDMTKRLKDALMTAILQK